MYMPAFERLEKANKEQVLSIIRSTKQKLGRLRNKMEHPNYGKANATFCPSDLVVYKCEREFLHLAILKLISLGGKYKESKQSLNDKQFNDRLQDITKITLVRRVFFSSCYKTVVDLSGEKLRVLSGDWDKLCEKQTDIIKEDFLYRLEHMHVGEWRKRYTPSRFGICVLDGEEWRLEFEYKNGEKKGFSGENAYPYNFDELIRLMGE